MTPQHALAATSAHGRTATFNHLHFKSDVIGRKNNQSENQTDISPRNNRLTVEGLLDHVTRSKREVTGTNSNVGTGTNMVVIALDNSLHAQSNRLKRAHILSGASKKSLVVGLSVGVIVVVAVVLAALTLVRYRNSRSFLGVSMGAAPAGAPSKPTTPGSSPTGGQVTDL